MTYSEFKKRAAASASYPGIKPMPGIKNTMQPKQQNQNAAAKLKTNSNKQQAQQKQNTGTASGGNVAASPVVEETKKLPDGTVIKTKTPVSAASPQTAGMGGAASQGQTMPGQSNMVPQPKPEPPPQQQQQGQPNQGWVAPTPIRINPQAPQSSYIIPSDMFATPLGENETYKTRIDAQRKAVTNALKSDISPKHVRGLRNLTYTGTQGSALLAFNKDPEMRNPETREAVQNLLAYHPDFANSVVNAIYNASPEAISRLTPAMVQELTDVLPADQADKVSKALLHMQSRPADIQMAGAQNTVQPADTRQEVNLPAEEQQVAAVQQPVEQQAAESAPAAVTEAEPDEAQEALAFNFNAPEDLEKAGFKSREDYYKAQAFNFIKGLPEFQAAMQEGGGAQTIANALSTAIKNPETEKMLLDALETGDPEAWHMFLDIKNGKGATGNKDADSMISEALTTAWKNMDEDQQERFLDVGKKAVYASLKDNFFKNLPNAISLWFKMKGWDQMGEFAQDPLKFYLTLTGIIGGGALLLGGGAAAASSAMGHPIINVGGSSNPYYNNEI